MDRCAGKLIRSNHRLMATYVQLMPRMVQRRMEEMESKAAENAKAAEALASSSQSHGPSPSPRQEPALSPSVSDDAPGAGGWLASPIALETDNSPVSHSAAASEVQLSAAAPHTPEEGFLHNLGSGASDAAPFPQPPIATNQITLESSPPVVMATPKPSTPVDAATVSKSTETPPPSEQQRP